MSTQRFVLIFLVVNVGGFMLLIAGALWVNPFGLFDWPNRAMNQRPMHSHGEVFKVRMIERHQPDFIIFGNSRAEVGFGVDDEVTGFANGVNAAISGGSFPEISRIIQHSLNVAKPKEMLLVIDPNSFTTASIRPSFEQLAIGRTIRFPEQIWRRVFFHSHWSYLWGEIDTKLRSKDSLRPAPFLDGDRGLRGDESIRKQLRSEGGSRVASLHWERTFSRPSSNFSATAKNNLVVYRNLVLESCQRGIRFVTLLPPMNTRMVKLWTQTYGASFLNDWLSQIRGINAKAGETCKGVSPELWSAMIANSITTEEIPDPGVPETEMVHYWETSHFRRHVGDDVLAQINGRAYSEWVPAERLEPPSGSQISSKIVFN